MQNSFPGYVFGDLRRRRFNVCSLQIFLWTPGLSLVSIHTHLHDKKTNKNRQQSFSMPLNIGFQFRLCHKIRKTQKLSTKLLFVRVCLVLLHLWWKKNCWCYTPVFPLQVTIFSCGKNRKLDILLFLLRGGGGISAEFTPALNICQLCWIVLKIANHKVNAP